MSILSKLGSFGVSLVSSKSTKKAAANVAGVASSRPVRKVGGSSSIIRTTSQTIGSTVPGIAGGKTVRKAIADATSKGASQSIVVAKKVAKSGIILGGTAGLLGLGGVKLYDYAKDVGSKSTALREYDQTLDLAERELNLTKKATDFANSATGQSSPGMALGGGLADYLPILGSVADKTDDVDIAQAKASQTKSLMTGLVLVAAIGGGLYAANKAGWFKKNKSSSSKKAKK